MTGAPKHLGISEGVKSLLRPSYRALKYRIRIWFQPRKNQIYSQFFRFPHQYQALEDRVLPAMGVDTKSDEVAQLKVLMFGCCHGDELYSLASVLRQYSPALNFDIQAYELVDSLVEKARSATYTKDEVMYGPFVTEAFVDNTFDINGENYLVKPALVARTRCHQGDLLDETLLNQLPQFDLVFAQNLLFHLPRNKVGTAFDYLVQKVKPGGFLFVNGMDTDQRVKFSKRFDLEPLDYLVEEIHNDARVDRGDAWANYYFGREPFSRESRNWLRKYATVFRKQVE